MMYTNQQTTEHNNVVVNMARNKSAMNTNIEPHKKTVVMDTFIGLGHLILDFSARLTLLLEKTFVSFEVRGRA